MGLVRAHTRLAIALCVCVLAAGGVIAGIVLTGGGGRARVLPTTGDYAPLSITRPKLYTAGGALISDPDTGVQAYLSTMVTQLPGVHRYRVTITNVSNLGAIDSLQWYPPMGVHIVDLIGSSAGRCELGGLTGFGGNQFKTAVLYPNILCSRVTLRPPTCTCLGDGGSIDISLVADRPMGAAGTARMISGQLVLHPIPSYVHASAPTASGSTG